jgi:acetone carboxylase alpha subunit
LPRYAEKVYGAVFTQDEKGRYVIDEKRTQERRQEMRKERLNRGVLTSEWMKQEREKVINKQASVQVRHMYAGSFALSQKFLREFKEFWSLPEQWNLTEEELGVPVYGAKIKHT